MIIKNEKISLLFCVTTVIPSCILGFNCLIYILCMKYLHLMYEIYSYILCFILYILICSIIFFYFLCSSFEAHWAYTCGMKLATWIDLISFYFLLFVSFAIILCFKMNIINPTIYNTVLTLVSQLRQVANFLWVFCKEKNENSVCHCDSAQYHWNVCFMCLLRYTTVSACHFLSHTISALKWFEPK